MAAPRTGRNRRLTVCVDEPNSNWLQEVGGAKQTGGGRLNASELINDFLTGIRLSWGKDMMILDMAKRIESATEKKDDMLQQFLQVTGGISPNDWMAEYYSKQSEQQKAEIDFERQARQKLEDLYNEIQEKIDRYSWTVQEWINQKNAYKEAENWNRVLDTGFGGSVRDFIKDFLIWQTQKDNPAIRLEDQVITK